MKRLYFLLFTLFAVALTVEAQPKILYVGNKGADEILPSDSITVVYLEEAQMDVTYVEDDDVETTYNYSGFDAVFFGEAMSSSKVVAFGKTNKYPIPCVVLEPQAPRYNKWAWMNEATDETEWQEWREGGTGWDKLQIIDTSHYITDVFEEDEVITWTNAVHDNANYQVYAMGIDLNTYVPNAVPLAQNMNANITFPSLWALEANTKVTATDTLKHRMVIFGTHSRGVANDDDDSEDFGELYFTEDFMTIAVRSLLWVLGANVGIYDVESQPFKVSVFPNPVSDYAKLKFTLDKPEMVSLRVINIVGQTVDTIEEQYMNRGSNEIGISTGDLPGGLYLFVLEAGSNKYTGKINVVK